jgi:hypothetical protein
MQNAKQRLESGENFIGGDIAVAGVSALPSLLSQLAELRQKGILTEEEFSRRSRALARRRSLKKPDE